jgi:endoglucanase
MFENGYRIRFGVILIAILTLTLSSKGAVASQGFLSVAGTEIVGAQGQPMRLIGMNLGWPKYITYEMQLPSGVEDNQGFLQQNVLDKYLSPSQAKSFFPILKEKFIRETDFKHVREMGFNLVRVGFSWRDFSRTYKGMPEPYYFLDKVILPDAKKNGLYVQICIFAGDDLRPLFYGDTPEATAFRGKFLNRWRDIAHRYANNKTVAIYDLVNEPNSDWKESSFRNYNQLLYDTIQAIRTVDKNHLIALEPDHWAAPMPDGGNLRILTQPHLLNETADPAHKIVWDYHTYKRGDFTEGDGITATQSAWNAIRKLQLRYDIPIQVGEIGAHWGETTWLKASLDIFDKFEWSWSYWTLKEVHPGYFSPYFLVPWNADKTTGGWGYYDLARDLQQAFRDNAMPRRWSDIQFEKALDQLDSNVGVDGKGWLTWDALLGIFKRYVPRTNH